MKSALPGIMLLVAGSLIIYWSMMQLGLFVPKGGKASTVAPVTGYTGNPNVPGTK